MVVTVDHKKSRAALGESVQAREQALILPDGVEFQPTRGLV